MSVLRVRMPIMSALVVAWLVGAAAADDPWGPDASNRRLERPVETTQEELARLPAADWYDSDKDELSRVAVTPPTAPDYRPNPPTPGGAQPNWNWPDFTWFFDLFSGGAGSLGAILIYVLLLAGLGVLAYLIFRYFENAAQPELNASPRRRAELDDTTSQVDRLESLPFQVKRPDSDLLAEARRCYDAGNYDEAIIYLFSYQLVELDKGQVIRLAKGKTNGQYLREIKKNFALQDILETTIRAFEDVFFGQRKLSQSRFERCWEELEPFRRHLSGGVS
ncbi:MAG: DUF4129 domain-containing protein [Blastopirellula sp. JB062]